LHGKFVLIIRRIVNRRNQFLERSNYHQRFIKNAFNLSQYWTRSRLVKQWRDARRDACRCLPTAGSSELSLVARGDLVQSKTLCAAQLFPLPQIFNDLNILNYIHEEYSLFLSFQVAWFIIAHFTRGFVHLLTLFKTMISFVW